VDPRQGIRSSRQTEAAFHEPVSDLSWSQHPAATAPQCYSNPLRHPVIVVQVEVLYFYWMAKHRYFEAVRALCSRPASGSGLWAPLNFACGARSTHRWEIEGVARHIDSPAAERHAFRFEAGALFEPCVSREAYVPACPHYAVPGDAIFGIVEGPCDLSGCARKARRARDIAVSRDPPLGNSPYCLAEPLQHIPLMLTSNDVRIDVSGKRLRAFRTFCVAVLR
jgi:hypothetical protein